MNELRWILLAAGIVGLALIYWQGRRKRLASNEALNKREIEPPQLGESSVVRRREPGTQMSSRAARVVVDDMPEVYVNASHASSDGVTLSMDQALSTAALDRLTITQPLNPRPEIPPQSRSEPADRVHSAPRPSAAALAPRTARKIVALRVPAVTRRFNGVLLRDAFSDQSLRHGRYGIYHRQDSQGAPIFSVASIVEPGTFEPATMTNEEYPGVSLFLQLPGPIDGVAAFDAMLACAQALRDEFDGDLQGERGKALTEDAIAHIREDIANFQHLQRSPSAGA
jgi:cell division protein ZipA